MMPCVSIIADFAVPQHIPADILNKCIRNKEYMNKIFYRLYGISR